MPLLSLWKSNPAAINELSIKQVVAAAGDGHLKDENDCCHELRAFLKETSADKIGQYIDTCLSTSFDKGGIVFQDLINELGRRLDFEVKNGRYQGTVSAIGVDGIWAADGHSIVIETKITDAFRIPLEVIAEYRRKLHDSGQLAGPSSIIVVVGREDTGELEAQVRGSRHAWDIRIISADALLRLVQLKLDADDPETGKKIRSLLVPREYTRLDSMIDVMFTTAKDVENAAGAEVGKDALDAASGLEKKSAWQFTDSEVLQAKREKIIAALAHREGASLIKKSRALYWDPSHAIRVVCTISKRYEKKNASPYWYAFHPQWDEFLGEGSAGYLILGCMDKSSAFVLPLTIVRQALDALHTTERSDGSRYWHLHLDENENGEIVLLLPKKKTVLPLSSFVLELTR